MISGIPDLFMSVVIGLLFSNGVSHFVRVVDLGSPPDENRDPGTGGAYSFFKLRAGFASPALIA